MKQENLKKAFNIALQLQKELDKGVVYSFKHRGHNFTVSVEQAALIVDENGEGEERFLIDDENCCADPYCSLSKLVEEMGNGVNFMEYLDIELDYDYKKELNQLNKLIQPEDERHLFINCFWESFTGGKPTLSKFLKHRQAVLDKRKEKEEREKDFVLIDGIKFNKKKIKEIAATL